MADRKFKIDLENQKFVLHKDLEGYHSPKGHLICLFKQQTAKVKGLEEQSIAACKLFDFAFRACPRVHRAKGPNREQQALSSDKERVEQPPSLFTQG